MTRNTIDNFENELAEFLKSIEMFILELPENHALLSPLQHVKEQVSMLHLAVAVFSGMASHVGLEAAMSISQDDMDKFAGSEADKRIKNTDSIEKLLTTDLLDLDSDSRMSVVRMRVDAVGDEIVASGAGHIFDDDDCSADTADDSDAWIEPD